MLLWGIISAVPILFPRRWQVPRTTARPNARLYTYLRPVIHRTRSCPPERAAGAATTSIEWKAGGGRWELHRSRPPTLMAAWEHFKIICFTLKTLWMPRPTVGWGEDTTRPPGQPGWCCGPYIRRWPWWLYFLLLAGNGAAVGGVNL